MRPPVGHQLYHRPQPSLCVRHALAHSAKREAEHEAEVDYYYSKLQEEKERLEEPVRHTLSFAWLDGRIWLRTYRIGAAITGGDKIELEEIGPRLVLAPVRIIAGAFGGAIIHNLP